MKPEIYERAVGKNRSFGLVHNSTWDIIDTDTGKTESGGYQRRDVATEKLHEIVKKKG